MITLAKEKLFLKFAEIRETPLPESVREYGPALDQLVQWVDEYLCKPHPKLGRAGPVCPFVPTALEMGLLYVLIFPTVDPKTDMVEIKKTLLRERDQFLAMEPRQGNSAQFKSFLMLFPNLPSPDSHQVIDSLQASLQEEFVEKGLMLGEFHPGPPNKRGLWNETFRPLTCPVPLLAIRHMVPTDILFLKEKSSLVAEYLRIFGDLVPSKFVYLVEEAAEKFGFDLPDKCVAKSSAPTVIYLLEKSKLSYAVHRHAIHDSPIHKPADFARALGCEVASISKTLFVRDPKRTTYALLVCGAAGKADLKKMATHLRVARLEFADDDERRRMIGHPRFSMTPIGIEGIPIFIDEDLFRFDTILTGSGVAKMELELAPRDLQRLSGAKVLSFLVKPGVV